MKAWVVPADDGSVEIRCPLGEVVSLTLGEVLEMIMIQFPGVSENDAGEPDYDQLADDITEKLITQMIEKGFENTYKFGPKLRRVVHTAVAPGPGYEEKDMVFEL